MRGRAGGHYDLPYFVDDESLNIHECPRSMMLRKPKMFALLMEIMGAEHVNDCAGATLYGQDSAKWDARYFDAVKLVQIQSLKVERAYHDVMERQ